MKLIIVDFVIWSPCQLVVLRIDYDSNFTDTAITKASEFYKCCILPELICKWHSKSVSVVPASRCDKWCYCGGCEEGEMIACDSDTCQIVWFHTECLKIDSIPDGKWYCPECQQ